VNVFSTFAVSLASAEAVIVIGPSPIMNPAPDVLSVFVALGSIVTPHVSHPLHIFSKSIVLKKPPFTEIIIVIFSAVVAPMFFTVTDTLPKPPVVSVISKIVCVCCAAAQDETKATKTSISIILRPDAFRRFFFRIIDIIPLLDTKQLIILWVGTIYTLSITFSSKDWFLGAGEGI